MIALYLLLPLALAIAGVAVLAFIWTVRSGQLDDTETPPRRMLFEDDGTRVPAPVPGAALAKDE